MKQVVPWGRYDTKTSVFLNYKKGNLIEKRFVEIFFHTEIKHIEYK
jgi:hypothetical protein